MSQQGPSEDSYDILVVGAGPTGLVLSNLLGKAGLAVLVVEANASTVGEPRAVSIDDESLRTVQALGLLDTVQRDIVGGYGSEYRSPAGATFLRVKPKAQPYGHPRRNAFRQPIFEAQLRDGLKRFADVETLFECTLQWFSNDEDGVVARLDHIGGQSTVRAAYMIGCDGARSFVRQALGYKLVGDSLDERWLIIDLADSPVDTQETIVFCDPRRPCIALPGPDQTRRYEFKVMPGEDEEALLADSSIAGLLERHGAAPGSKLVRKTIYHFHARVADHWGRGRVWLAGDAAHLSPPFAGQGMNSGVRDARNIAWKLVEIIRGRLGPRLLLSYQQERHGHVSEMIKLALRMGAIMGPRSRAHGSATRAMFRTLSLWPAARSYFAEMKYKPPPHFAKGFLISSAKRHGMVGRLLPQPYVRDGSGGKVRLDDLLGHDFVLLGIDVEPSVLADVFTGTRDGSFVTHRLALTSAQVPELSPNSGELLLLRPDHYVMARFSAHEADAVEIALDRLIAETWPDEARSAA